MFKATGEGCLEVNECANALNTTPFEKQRNPAKSLRYACLGTFFSNGATGEALEVEKQDLHALPAGASPARYILQQFEKGGK